MDFVELMAALTDFIQNERVRAYNDGVENERQRCFSIARDHGGQNRKMLSQLIERGETEEDRRLKALAEQH